MAKNGFYIGSWLATELIAQRLYQEAKSELGKSRGNMGYKRENP